MNEDINRVEEILTKIVEYQHTHSGEAVALHALVAIGVLSPEDQAFLESHAIEYKPHSVADYHAGDMFHIPTDEGCIFVGPVGPPLPKHSARVSELPAIIERVLGSPMPADELLLHIELTATDGVGISPGFLCFILRSPEWRLRAETLKSVAAEHSLSPFQDSPELQGNHILSFTTAADTSSMTRIASDLLRRGLDLPDDRQITYASGAVEVG